MRGLLPVELAAHRPAVLGGPEPLEAVVDELGVLLVEVLVGHDVRGAGVHLAAAHLQERERAERLEINDHSKEMIRGADARVSVRKTGSVRKTKKITDTLLTRAVTLTGVRCGKQNECGPEMSGRFFFFFF